MTDTFTRADYEATAASVRARTRHTPKIALVLGSGLGPVAEAVQNADVIPGDSLPHWPRSTVEGHTGQLVIGHLEEQTVLIQQGRAHYYEGYSLPQITLPIRVMQLLGIQILIITNAAGAINPEFRPGDLMLITDHINLLGMAGLSPLRGPNDETLGPRFPDMSRAYDRDLRALALAVADKAQLHLQEGVYVGLAGPSFETPADLRFLRLMGADAVGMSTVPEVTVARHGGLRVLGLSGISNKANLDGNTTTTHAEVLAAGHSLAPKLSQLLRGLLRRLPTNPTA